MTLIRSNQITRRARGSIVKTRIYWDGWTAASAARVGAMPSAAGGRGRGGGAAARVELSVPAGSLKNGRMHQSRAATAGQVLGGQFAITLTDMHHLVGQVGVLGTCPELGAARHIAELVSTQRGTARLVRVRVNGVWRWRARLTNCSTRNARVGTNRHCVLPRWHSRAVANTSVVWSAPAKNQGRIDPRSRVPRPGPSERQLGATELSPPGTRELS